MSQTTIRNLIISIIILVIVGGAVAGVFIKLLKDSQTLEKQIVAVASQNQHEAGLIRLQKIAKASESEREELSSQFLFRESDTSDFLSEIEELVPIMGVQRNTPDLKKITIEGKEWVEVSFNVTGDRTSVQDFINVLEIVPYVSKVTSVNLSGEKNGDWKADIIIQVQLLSYD